MHDGDIKAGNLLERFDTIILPDQSPEQIVAGYKAGVVPPDYAGGMTDMGVENLKQFVESGGTLVCNKASLDLAIRMFSLPLKNVVRGLPQKDFFVPGSVFRVDFDAAHPVAYGMDAHGYAYVSGAHAFDLPSDVEPGRDDKADKKEADAKAEKPKNSGLTVFARFPNEALLASGFAVGEQRMRGKAVGVEAAVGKWRVVLFGFNVQNRAQSYATHKLLYNALFLRAGR